MKCDIEGNTNDLGYGMTPKQDKRILAYLKLGDHIAGHDYAAKDYLRPSEQVSRFQKVISVLLGIVFVTITLWIGIVVGYYVAINYSCGHKTAVSQLGDNQQEL